MSRSLLPVLTVLVTLLSSFVSLHAVLAEAARFGFSPAQLKDPAAVFRLDTVVPVLAVLLLPIAIVLSVQRFVHKGRARDLGFAGPWTGPFGWGLSAGVAVKLAALGAALALSGHARVASVSQGVSFAAWLPFFAWYLFALVLNSLAEELVYRAYPITALKGLPAGSVILASAGIFSAMHFLIEPPDAFRFAYRLAFGIAAGLLFARKRSLWAVAGLHTGWNFVAISFSGTHWRLGGLLAVTGMTERGEAVANIAALAAFAWSVRAWGRTREGGI